MDTGYPAKPWRAGQPLKSLRRRLAQSTALSRRLDVETLEPRVLLSADLLPIHGSIDVPGQTNRYTFTLTDSKQLYFDSETNNTSLNWSLEGPAGSEVANRSFASSDGVDFSGSPLLQLRPGDYTLSVNGSGHATGTYDFRLLDAANATAITPGTPVSGTLDPGNETNLYQFQASAGQSFFFNSTGFSGSDARWRLVGPNNTLIFDQTWMDSDPGARTLAQDGTYYLSVEGRYNVGSPQTYSFNVQPIVTNSFNLTVGATQAGTIATAGQIDKYSFTLANPTNVLFDSLTNASNLTWSLTGPRGQELGARNLISSDAAQINGCLLYTSPSPRDRG